MKKILPLLMVLILVVSIPGQSFLTAEQDVGFDIAQTNASNSVIRTEPDNNAPVVKVFQANYRLTLLNRFHRNGWYEVSDIFSLKRGWIHGNQINLFFSHEDTRLGVQTKPRCSEPLYLTDADDNGYDVVRLKPIWLNRIDEKTGKVSKIRESVILNLEYGIPDYITYDKETDLLLLSREQTNGALKALDLEKNIAGTVNCDFQIYYTSKTKTDNNNLFVKHRASNSLAAPIVTIQNSSDRELSLFIDGIKHLVLPKSSKTLSFSPGNYTYVANATGVRPLTGISTWDQGHIYTWEFYIKTVLR